MNKCFTIILILLLLGGIGLFVWFFIQSMLEADPGINAAIIGAVAVIAVGIWSHHSTKLREINSRHFIEKKNAYMQFIEMMFEVLKAEKEKDSSAQTNEPPKHETKEFQERMFKFKRDLLVWGNHEVISALQNFEESSTINRTDGTIETDPIQILLIIDDLLRAIRKDLGHNDDQLKRGTLSGVLLIQEDREKLLSDKNVKEAL